MTSKSLIFEMSCRSRKPDCQVSSRWLCGHSSNWMTKLYTQRSRILQQQNWLSSLSEDFWAACLENHEAVRVVEISWEWVACQFAAPLLRQPRQCLVVVHGHFSCIPSIFPAAERAWSKVSARSVQRTNLLLAGWWITVHKDVLSHPSYDCCIFLVCRYPRYVQLL